MSRRSTRCTITPSSTARSATGRTCRPACTAAMASRTWSAEPRRGMKPEIVIIGPMYPPTQARLEAEFTAYRLWEASDPAAFLRGLVDRVRGIAVYALHGCPAWVIEALPRLEIIACMGIGV